MTESQIARNLNYLSEEQRDSLIIEMAELGRILNGLISCLQHRKSRSGLLNAWRGKVDVPQGPKPSVETAANGTAEEAAGKIIFGEPRGLKSARKSENKRLRRWPKGQLYPSELYPSVEFSQLGVFSQPVKPCPFETGFMRQLQGSGHRPLVTDH